MKIRSFPGLAWVWGFPWGFPWVGLWYGMDMGAVMNPHGPVGIIWRFSNGVRLSGNALNAR